MGKKKPNTPRRLRMNRKTRLQAARAWIPTYPGKSIVRGYKRWFSVDELCAVVELTILGVIKDCNRVSEVKAAARQRQQRAERKKLEEQANPDNDQDETFAYIAGYTAAGFPYGVTWEELPPEERF